MGRSYSDKVKSSSGSGSRKGRARRNDNDRDKPPFPLAPVIVIGLIIILIIAGLVIYNQDDDEEGGNDIQEDDDTKGGPEYLNIDLESTSEGIIELNDHYGKVIVLDMFATWCSPCKEQMRELKVLESYYSSSDVVILSVDVDPREDLGMIRDFKSETDADWTFAMSTDRFTSNFPAESIPTLYILDRNGIKVDEHVGVITAGDLKDKIDLHI